MVYWKLVAISVLHYQENLGYKRDFTAAQYVGSLIELRIGLFWNLLQPNQIHYQTQT